MRERVTVGFDPARYLTWVNGSDYLEVKWRLVWLRDQHPGATIETELVEHGDRVAVFRALVTLPSGGAATGWGSESAGDFRDYLEKAESKAIGRALAALGFGTQFCVDHDVEPAMEGTVTAFAPRDGQDDEERVADGQIRYLETLAGRVGIAGDGLEHRAIRKFGVGLARLTRRQARELQQEIQEDAKPTSANPTRPAELPGITAIRGSAGNDQHSL